MDILALSWIVLSKSYLGMPAYSFALVSAAEFLPFLLISPVVSRLLGSVPRKLLLLACELAECLTAGLFASYVLTVRRPEFGIIIVYAAIIGLLQAVEVPTRQVLIMDILLEDFKDGYSKFVMSSRLMGIIAPIAGGIILARYGPSTLFFANAASFGLVFIMVSRIQVSSADVADPKSGGRRLPPVRWLSIILLTILVGAIGNQFPVTNVLIATHRFSEGSTAYGVMSGVSAVGAFLGARLAARLPDWRVLPLGAAVIFGIAEVFAGLAFKPYLYVCLLFILGVCFSVYTVTTVTMINRDASGRERNSILAYYNGSLIGCVPVGTMIVGFLASINISWSLVVPGSLIFLCGIAVLGFQGAAADAGGRDSAQIRRAY